MTLEWNKEITSHISPLIFNYLSKEKFSFYSIILLEWEKEITSHISSLIFSYLSKKKFFFYSIILSKLGMLEVKLAIDSHKTCILEDTSRKGDIPLLYIFVLSDQTRSAYVL